MDECDSKKRSDVVPDYDKQMIDEFYRHHVPISPKKRDTVRLRHPYFPSQIKVKQAMHQFETMYGLLLKLKDEHTSFAEGYQYEKRKNTCLKIVRDNAPW